jgi:hypothetical protein
MIKRMKVCKSDLLPSETLLMFRIDAVFEIPFAIPYDGAVDTVVIKSYVTWSDIQLQLSEAMVIPAIKLNLGYKFSMDPRNMAPTHLANGVHLLELIEGAKDGLEAVAWAKTKIKAAGKKPKPFKVEITDHNAGKDKGKGKKASGDKVKCKRKVRQSKILTMDIVG